MATWVTHLRIAENLLKEFGFQKEEFLAGNIGPDCGVPNEDWTKFNPPKQITHWYPVKSTESEIKDNNQIGAERFYLKHINETSVTRNNRELSFLLGYYTHLLTDIEWANLQDDKIKNDKRFADQFVGNPQFIREVWQDWFGLDFAYLRDKKPNVFTEVFMKIDFIPDYLDYIPKGAFTSKVKYIIDFYNFGDDNYTPTDRYLVKEDMESFIEEATKVISEKLKEKHFIKKVWVG